METLSFNGYLHDKPDARAAFDELLGYMGDYIENLANAPKDPHEADNAEVDSWIEENVDNLIDQMMQLRATMNKAFREMFERKINELEVGTYPDPTAVKRAMNQRIYFEKVLDALKVPTRVQFDRSFSDADAVINTSEAKANAKLARTARKAAKN